MRDAMDILTLIVLHAATLSLVLGSVLALFFGAAIYMGQGWIFGLNDRLAQWVSTRALIRPLEVPRNFDPLIYRWHRAIGLVFAAAALYILYALLFVNDLKAVASLFGKRDTASLIGMMVDTSRWIIVIGALLALFLGVALFFRPDLVRAAGAWADRTYSARRAARPMETMNLAPDQWVASHPRLFGGLVVAGSLYVIFMLGGFMLTHS